MSSYLLVFEGDSCRVEPLPDEGERVLQGGARLAIGADLTAFPIEGAQALVNGEPLEQPRVLASGDELVIGASTYIVQLRSARAAPSERAVLEPAALRQRLSEEIERALRYGHQLAVVLVAAPDRERVQRVLRKVDVLGKGRGEELVCLLPETGEEAITPAARVLSGSEARVGIALCPDDATDADALLGAARAAAQAARAGGFALARDTARTLSIGDHEVVVADPVMRRVFGLVEKIAGSDLPVLVAGETGVGKELVATAVHAWSKRSGARLVAVNCAAISETLLESELFGHERGAFTGAVAAKAGLIESADHGTLFLDEVNECSPGAQAKLLRVLETKRVVRVGALVERAADVRVVAATNKDLEAEVAAGRFRRDLYFRLAAATLLVPPLRDRPLDLAPLARRFLDEACDKLGRKPLALSSHALQRLSSHDWSGNVRELRNAMDWAAATAGTEQVEAADLPERIGHAAAPWLSRPKVTPSRALAPRAEGFRNLHEEVRELERTRMQEALDAAGGVRVRAAELIGMPLRTFVTKLREYDLGGPRRTS